MIMAKILSAYQLNIYIAELFNDCKYGRIPHILSSAMSTVPLINRIFDKCNMSTINFVQ